MDLRPWESKLSQELKHTIDDTEEKLKLELSMLNSSDRLSAGVGMYSEVTYADEFEHEKVNLGVNRSYECLFFEITTFDDKKRYRSALSEDELLTKYKNIKSVKQIKQIEYACMREYAHHTGEDDLD